MAMANGRIMYYKITCGTVCFKSERNTFTYLSFRYIGNFNSPLSEKYDPSLIDLRPFF